MKTKAMAMLAGIFMLLGPATPAQAAPIGPFGTGIFQSAQDNFKREVVWQAAPIAAIPHIDPGELCIFQHKDYQGAKVCFFQWEIGMTFGKSLEGRYMNNRSSSVISNWGIYASLIGNKECKGSYAGGYELRVSPGRAIPNLANIDNGYPNDRISCVAARG